MFFVKFVVFWFAAMTIVYFSVSLYSRSVRRERLENAFDADHPDGTEDAVRDAYVAKGMKDYDNSLRRKLIVFVYVVPFLVMSAIIYFVNQN